MNLQGDLRKCHLSQLFFHIYGEFLCSLERKKPELFKTYPTFIFSPLLMPSIACWMLNTLFLGHPVYLDKKHIIYCLFSGTPVPSLTNTLMTSFSCGMSQCQTTAVNIVMVWCTKQTLSLKLSSIRTNVRQLRLQSVECFQVLRTFLEKSL